MSLLSASAPSLYIASFSSKTIVYKGMMQSAVLPAFYNDLTDPDFATNFCIYHRRFSTNTNPKWPLAQPMRILGHNGEINTLLGNVNWMIARESSKGETSLDVSEFLDETLSDRVLMEKNTQSQKEDGKVRECSSFHPPRHQRRSHPRPATLLSALYYSPHLLSHRHLNPLLTSVTATALTLTPCSS